jgi:beta-lactamase class A
MNATRFPGAGRGRHHARSLVAVLAIGPVLAGCGGMTRPAPAPAPANAPAPAAVTLPADPSLDELESRIRARVVREAGAEVAVALIDLGTGLHLEVDGDRVMHAASTMKVPVLLEVFRQAETGRFSLDDRLPVTDTFRSIVDDAPYVLPAESDSDSTLYARVGSTETIRELVRLMIVRSSNLALNLLIDHVGAANVRRTMDEIGASEMDVRRGVEDLAAYRAGLNNTTTAHGLAVTLEAIARCSITRRAACDEMIDILAAQEFNEMIPAGLPAGTRIAHKTGWITGAEHDGAIVFPGTRAPWVLVVLTRGITDRARAATVGADISRMVWDQLTDPSFGTAVPVTDATTRELLALHARYRVGSIGQRHFGHAQLWRALVPIATGPITREEVGLSGEGRSMGLLRYGDGPVRVLFWSQMHGDESTATMALADLVNYLHATPQDARVRDWAERLTILLLPMLNPDGAERFQRYDAYGVDVNRDVRTLATPEGRTLKAVRDRYEPQFGFNLHDQNPRTRVGSSQRVAAISLLAPAVDDDATETPSFVAAKHVAATVERAIAPLVGGYVTRYDETFNPRAFGDLVQQWGTSAVLIESGGWRMDPENQYLRAVNFVALVHVLDAIAADTFRTAPLGIYEGLPGNGRSLIDVLVLGGTVVLPGGPPARVDIAANLEGGSGGALHARITEIGDLAGVLAKDTIDVSGLFLHPAHDTPPGSGLAPGMDATFLVRASPEPDSRLLFRIERGRRRPVGSAARQSRRPLRAVPGQTRTRSGGSRPAKNARRFPSARMPMSVRVSTDALPMWGRSTTLGNSSRPASTTGSRS